MLFLLFADFYHVILMANPPTSTSSSSCRSKMARARTGPTPVMCRFVRIKPLSLSTTKPVPKATVACSSSKLTTKVTSSAPRLTGLYLPQTWGSIVLSTYPLDPLDTSSALSATIAGCTAEITSVAQDAQPAQVPQLARSPKSTPSLLSCLCPFPASSAGCRDAVSKPARALGKKCQNDSSD